MSPALQPGILCRTVGDIGDDCAGCSIKADRLGNVGGYVLEHETDPTPASGPEFLQLGDDLGNNRRGHGETDAQRTRGRRAGPSDDGRVDANDLTVLIEQGPAGISDVDGGIGLEEVVIGAVERPVPGRDDAGGNGKAETVRIADGPGPGRRPVPSRCHRT